MLFLEETKIPKITITGTVHGSVLIGPLQIGGDADFSCNKQITYQPIIDEQLIKELIAELIEIKKNIKQKNNQIETDSKKQIQNFLTIKQFTPKDKEILEKTINFLDAKKIFLNLRQGTIDSLQACCNKFEQAHTTGKYAIIDDVSDIITSVGEITDPLITTSISVSPVKAVGGIMKGVNNLFKNKSLSNNKNEISKVVIDIFDLKKNKTSLFSEHDVFNVLNIWKGKSVITLDEMKDSIEKLNSDLKEFKAKLESEENQFQQRIFTKFEESNNQRHQTQIEVPPKS
ncbi:4669_t:CDS:2 [Funneliformis geosporum]|nr:4669_t:CDS:2 [Funneliformis geosporum]